MDDISKLPEREYVARMVEYYEITLALARGTPEEDRVRELLLDWRVRLARITPTTESKDVLDHHQGEQSSTSCV